MSASALQQAIFERLSADATLTALLGEHRVHDRLIEKATLPHILFATIDSRDWSTSTESGEEHTLRLEVWSDENGKREAQSIMAAVKAALHDRALTLAGHRLVNLRLVSSTLKREPKSRRHEAILTFRAVTEPL